MLQLGLWPGLVFVPLESLYTGKHILSQNTQYSILGHLCLRGDKVKVGKVGVYNIEMALKEKSLEVLWMVVRSESRF